MAFANRCPSICNITVTGPEEPPLLPPDDAPETAAAAADIFREPEPNIEPTAVEAAEASSPMLFKIPCAIPCTNGRPISSEVRSDGDDALIVVFAAATALFIIVVMVFTIVLSEPIPVEIPVVNAVPNLVPAVPADET